MIFSIGTSNRSLAEFLHELQSRSITHIVDLRSSPYSRFAWFNRGMISRWAPIAGLMVREEGEVLGGRSDFEPTSEPYRHALDRIIQASCRENVAIFCAEGDPAQCHRSFEVGADLLVTHGIVIKNILRNGQVEDATATLARTSLEQVPDHIRSDLSTILRRPNDLFRGAETVTVSNQ